MNDGSFILPDHVACKLANMVLSIKKEIMSTAEGRAEYKNAYKQWFFEKFGRYPGIEDGFDERDYD